MTQEHPITPPPELVQQWGNHLKYDDSTWFYENYIATQAARWGADAELEACCKWFVQDWTDIETADKLRAARRPKPLSLRTALQELVEEVSDVNGYIPPGVLRAIKNARTALEALPDA